TGTGGSSSVALPTLLPLADATLRALRHGEGVSRALDVDVARHLLLITLPCNAWADVRLVEQFVLERLEFTDAPDPQCIGIYFSGYRPDPLNREERIFAIKLGAVAGGWQAVYDAISRDADALPVEAPHVNGRVHQSDDAVTSAGGST